MCSVQGERRPHVRRGSVTVETEGFEGGVLGDDRYGSHYGVAVITAVRWRADKERGSTIMAGGAGGVRWWVGGMTVWALCLTVGVNHIPAATRCVTRITRSGAGRMI